MRLVWIFILAISVAYGAPKQDSIKSLWDKEKPSTKNRIKSSKDSLKKTGIKHKQMNNKLSKIAKSIIKAEKDSIKLDIALKELGRDKEVNEKKFNVTKKQLDAFGSRIENLDQSIKEQNRHFQDLLINQFSLIIAMHKIDKPTVDSVIMREIYDTYKEQNAKSLNTLKEKIDIKQREKETIVSDQQKIKRSISKIAHKRNLYIKKKAQKRRLLKKLSEDEKNYRKSIKQIVNRQSLIRSTLSKLNIIRKEEISEAVAREKAREAEIDRRAKARLIAREDSSGTYNPSKSFKSDESVKQYGSSYQKKNIHSYRGAKTISPLKSARVVKSFGTYTDPIYKMKIFNESITLKSRNENAKVRNVLNGKVVFAGRNSMLGKVIIVEHSNKLHTIYAGLSKISPLVKTGSRVKKGTIIGRVKRKLIFEATKNSKYINPLRLIRI